MRFSLSPIFNIVINIIIIIITFAFRGGGE